MSQIHKRFSDEQIRVLFQGYCQGQFSRSNLQELLAVEALEERAPHVGVDWPLLVVDGFDHFTEVQLGLLKALADRVGEMIITLTGSMEGSKRRPVHPYLVS